MGRDQEIGGGEVVLCSQAGGSMSPGSGGMRVGNRVGLLSGGEMLTLKSHVPLGSLEPWRMGCPLGYLITRWLASK